MTPRFLGVTPRFGAAAAAGAKDTLLDSYFLVFTPRLSSVTPRSQTLKKPCSSKHEIITYDEQEIM